MPKWMGLTLPNSQIRICRASEKKYGTVYFRGLAVKLKEMEQAGEVTLDNDIERAKYLTGMARGVKNKVQEIRAMMIPTIPGKPDPSGELPRMRFKLGVAMEILNEGTMDED